MDSHDRRLMAFLAGDLDPVAAKGWDEHLLSCERCWQAVREDRDGRRAARLLRARPPAGLADRVAFAVELAAAAETSPPRSRRSLIRLRWLAAAAALAVGLAVTVTMLLLPAGQQGVPAAVAVVVRHAELVLPPAPPPGQELRARPVQIGQPVTMTAGRQRIEVRTWRLGRIEAVVAVSRQPFAMPHGADGVPGAGMAWTARMGNLGLYCVNGSLSELVAARVPKTELAALEAR